MKKLTYEAAATQYIRNVLLESEEDIQEIVKDLTDYYKPHFIVEDLGSASFELSLARISLAIPAIFNLFEESRARKISSKINQLLTSITQSDYPADEIKVYSKLYIAEIEQKRELPLSGIADRLLQIWLNENARHFFVQIDGKETDIFYPTLIQAVSTAAVKSNSAMYWKEIRNNCELY
jgi:hypothetical protein